ncbi:MAG: LapA family protein [Actinobacteria bacterium]|nr:LapA family protein [Actinomycetota bacterium]
MSRKGPATPAGSSRSHVSPRLITALVLTVLALVFIFQNNQLTAIRLLIPVVTMPLWAALAGMLIVGAAIGYAMNWRQR